MNRTYLFGLIRFDDITIRPDKFPNFAISATTITSRIFPWATICTQRRVDGHIIRVNNVPDSSLPEFTEPELIHIEHSLDTRPGSCLLCESIRDKCKELRDEINKGEKVWRFTGKNQ
jgi:hypothetical protein